MTSRAIPYTTSLPHGLMFHHFHGGGHPKGQGAIIGDELEKLLRYVGLERILPPEDWLERLEGGGLREGDLCLTFDDALLCQYELALPVLNRLGLKAFWFVYSSVFEGVGGNLEVYRLFRTSCFDSEVDFYRVFFERVERAGLSSRAAERAGDRQVEALRAQFPFYSLEDARFRLVRDRVLGPESYERIMDQLLIDFGADRADLSRSLWMTDDHLVSLSRQGHAVGLHSYSHPTRLEELSPSDQAAEYFRNHAHLSRVCGRKPRSMSHPCNSYSSDTLRILRDLEIVCGFRSNLAPSHAGGPLNAHPLELARNDHAVVIEAMSRG